MDRTAYIDKKVLLKLLLLAASFIICSWDRSAFADGSSTPFNGGGVIGAKDIIRRYNQTGELFRIEGTCQSSCTRLLKIKNVCVDPSATLLFHESLTNKEANQGLKPDPARQSSMLNSYNAQLRNFIVSNHYIDSYELHAISGSDLIHKFGYRECPRK